MVFSSLEFIFIFIPIFFGCYYLVPNNWKNTVLLLGSMVFYLAGSYNHPELLVLLIINIVVDFFIGLLIEKYRKRGSLFLLAGILFHVVCIGFFKYSGFVMGELNRIFPPCKIEFSPILPIGISFYTFQGISYIVDVYRKKVRAEKSLLDFSVYISMFQQLIAGPIVTYGEIRESLHHRKIKIHNIKSGIGIFIFGLGLKVLLANPVGKLWTDVKAIGYESVSMPLAWMAIVAFSLQIYFDFWGYSLMASGLGKMLGFKLPKNFDFPYTSCSMTEFWRRWHMTLGRWFREYVYIPLGGNRHGAINTIRNLLMVWLLTGIWHGAGYNFILWGFVLFIILVLEKYILGKYLKKEQWLGHLYMALLIPLTWAIFAIDDLEQLKLFFTRLFPFFGQGVWSVFRYDYLKYLKLYFPFLTAGILFCTKLPFAMLMRIKKSKAMVVILGVIFMACVYCMYRGLDDPFLYFRF